MMRKRLTVSNEEGVYHVICRTAYQVDKLSDESKSVFIALLRKQARFSGVEVLSYCVLDNHFHLLIKIPYLNSISDRELVERYTALYGAEGTEYRMPPSRLQSLLSDGGEAATRMRKGLFARMQDLSIFIKELKQRFGIWFNRRHDNTGTLWSDRFHSLLVENSEDIISLVSAYIELNPVRLKKCEEPASYPYSSGRCQSSQFVFEGNTSHASPNQNDLKSHELSIQLKQKIHAISHGKLIGSERFIRQWESSHVEQLAVKKKNKWYGKALVNVLWGCLSLTEIHRMKKSTLLNP